MDGEDKERREKRTARIGCPTLLPITRLGFRIALLLLGSRGFARKSGGKTDALQKLFEPFVYVDAFGIFPGGAGDEMDVAGEDFGIQIAEPVGNLGGGGFLGRGGGCLFGDFPGFGDPAVFQAGPVDFLKIEEADAVQSFRELRAGGCEGRR